MILTENEVVQQIDRLSAERLSICVTRLWVKPRRGERGPAFDETDLARLTLIVELTEDMAVNDEAMPVVLGLLDEVSSLRKRMKALDEALNAEGPDICETLIARLQSMRDNQ